MATLRYLAVSSWWLLVWLDGYLHSFIAMENARTKQTFAIALNPREQFSLRRKMMMMIIVAFSYRSKVIWLLDDLWVMDRKEKEKRFPFASRLYQKIFLAVRHFKCKTVSFLVGKSLKNNLFPQFILWTVTKVSFSLSSEGCLEAHTIIRECGVFGGGGWVSWLVFLRGPWAYCRIDKHRGRHEYVTANVYVHKPVYTPTLSSGWLSGNHRCRHRRGFLLLLPPTFH